MPRKYHRDIWDSAPNKTQACKKIVWQKGTLGRGMVLEMEYRIPYIQVECFFIAHFSLATRFAVAGVEVKRESAGGAHIIPHRCHVVALDNVKDSIPFFTGPAGVITLVPPKT